MNRLFPCLFCAALTAFSSFSVHAEKLVILHTNDTHSQIQPRTDDNLGGVLRRAALIDSIRDAEPNVMLIDAGDFVQGTLYFYLYGGKVEQELMNRLGYDIRILGNHEFDNSIDSIATIMADTKATLLSTNYDLSRSAFGNKFKPTVIKEVGGRRIGFIGINLDPKGMITPGNYNGVEYMPAIEAANAAAWWLKHVEKVDQVVAITHIGYASRGSQLDDNALAAASKDIDLIIGGHSHTFLDPANPNPQMPNIVKNTNGDNVLIAQMDSYGRHLGRVDIDLDNFTKESFAYTVDSRYDNRLDPELQAILVPYNAGVDSLYNLKVAKSAVELPEDSPALSNLVSDFLFFRGEQLAGKGRVDFALLNNGGLRRGLPKGIISEGAVIDMMPFRNFIQVVEISGNDLIDAVNVMAQGRVTGLSAQAAGTYDPEGKRMLDFTINGQPIDPRGTYRIATIDYLVKGGDYMTPLTHGRIVAESKEPVYTELLKYLRRGPLSRKAIKPDDKLRFVPVKK